MVVTYKNLKLINFPVFGLPDFDIDFQDGLVKSGGFVIDDRNQLGEDLGTRRLQTPHELLKIRAAYEDIASFLSAKDKYFIDSKGYVFIYEKTKFVRIKYHKIVSVVPKDTYTILKLFEVSFPILVKRPPPPGKTWVGMIYFKEHPWLPYEYSENDRAILRRKI